MHGIGDAGRFESYFRTFRTRVLPLVHPRHRVEALFTPRDRAGRDAFYERRWDTPRWRCMFRVFFSRFVMGRLGRDPALFAHVDGDVAGRLLARTRHALTALRPEANPYLQWILHGRHTTALPHYLREENVALIRSRLDRLEWRLGALDAVLGALDDSDLRFDRFNLSDIFEYMSADAYRGELERIIAHARPGARLVYWNMLVPRRRPDTLADRLATVDARALFDADKAFFYSDLVVEEVRG